MNTNSEPSSVLSSTTLFRCISGLIFILTVLSFYLLSSSGTATILPGWTQLLLSVVLILLLLSSAVLTVLPTLPKTVIWKFVLDWLLFLFACVLWLPYRLLKVLFYDNVVRFIHPESSERSNRAILKEVVMENIFSKLNSTDLKACSQTWRTQILSLPARREAVIHADMPSNPPARHDSLYFNVRWLVSVWASIVFLLFMTSYGLFAKLFMYHTCMTLYAYVILFLSYYDIFAHQTQVGKLNKSPKENVYICSLCLGACIGHYLLDALLREMIYLIFFGLFFLQLEEWRNPSDSESSKKMSLLKVLGISGASMLFGALLSVLPSFVAQLSYSVLAGLIVVCLSWSYRVDSVCASVIARPMRAACVGFMLLDCILELSGGNCILSSFPVSSIVCISLTIAVGQRIIAQAAHKECNVQWESKQQKSIV